MRLRRTDILDGNFDLMKNTRIVVEHFSPLFRLITETDYSYPFALPKTERNRKIFQFTDEWDAIGALPQDIPAELELEGERLTGLLSMSEVTDTAYSMFFIVKDAVSIALETKITTIDLGGDREIIGGWASMREHANDVANAAIRTYDYAFAPVWNPKLHDGATDFPYNVAHTYSGIVNMWDYQAKSFFEEPNIFRIVADGALTDYETATKVPTVSSFVPFPYLVYVLERIAAHLNMKISSAWMQDAAIQRLVIYNTFTLDAVSPRTFGLDTYYVMDSANVINLQNHVPDITIGELLTGIQEIFNLRIEIQENTLSIEKKNLYSTPTNPIPADTIALTTQAPFQLEKGYSYQLKADDNCEISTGYTAITIPYENVKEDIANEAAFPSDTENTVRFCIEEGQDFMIQYAVAKKQPIITQGGTLEIGEAEKQIPISCNTVPTYRGYTYKYIQGRDTATTPTIYTANTGIIPMAMQTGISTYYNVGEKGNFSFRLLSYMGMQPSIQGDPSPMLSNHIYDNDNNAIANTLSFKWVGTPQCLYPLWHSNWQFDGKRKVTLRAKIDSTILKKLKQSARFILQGREILIISLSVPYAVDGIETAEIQAILL